ncbi:hypothetical protein B0H66DRAFT_555824 [Apodospora peruviana]|uniref:PLL-like beta propeller domain-containing protein n=1 Tax=Apodospora peruviana TaxID=516989 RepID=A0AAE0I3J6_9PEZI|nr:hypothetical protein B0H66DRAFT_555824 [Apodospora peruviana]
MEESKSPTQVHIMEEELQSPRPMTIEESQSPRPLLPIERSQSDYSALQVVDAEHNHNPSPQVLYDDNAPQVVFDDDKFHDGSLDASSPEVVTSGEHLPEVVSMPGGASGRPPVPWWRRKRFLAAITVAIVIVVVVLGAVLGTRKKSESSTALRASACNNTVCPQILSAAVLGPNTTDDRKLMVFARGDGAIYFNWAQIANLSDTGGWPADSRWSALVGGASFVSQPSAMSWNSGSRVSVATMVDGTGTESNVQMTKFTVDESGPNGFTVDGWKDLGGPVGSPLGTCAINGTRGDYYSVENTAEGAKFLHNLSHRNGTVDMWKHPDQLGVPQWDVGANFTFNQTAKPAVVCRPSYWVHDLVFYDDKSAVRHGMWAFHIPGNHWTEFTDLGGKFKGEPTVIAVGADRIDFFGIGEDAAMYHFTWTEADSHSALESLGGSFHSAASAVATGLIASSTGNSTVNGTGSVRIDVVALGMNDHIFHRVMRGKRWVSDWEDLGVEGNSAPLVVHYGHGSSEQPERVGVFMVGYDGQVKQATWTVSVEQTSWKDLKWTSMGGAMTSDFFRFET